MKKGQFWGASSFTVYIVFAVIIIIFLGFFTFEKRADQNAIQNDFEKYGFHSVYLSFLRNEIKADVDSNGETDAETVADLIVLGYKNEKAREYWKKINQDLISEIGTPEDEYWVLVVYPINDKMFVGIKEREIADDMTVPSFYLPLIDKKERKTDLIKIYAGKGITTTKAMPRVIP